MPLLQTKRHKIQRLGPFWNRNVLIAPLQTSRICWLLFLEIPLRLDEPVFFAETCIFHQVMETHLQRIRGRLNVQCLGSNYSNWIRFFSMCFASERDYSILILRISEYLGIKGDCCFSHLVKFFLVLVFVQIELLQFVAYCLTFAK